MTYNEFEGKPLRWDQPTSGPQCGLSLEVSLYFYLRTRQMLGPEEE